MSDEIYLISLVILGIWGIRNVFFWISLWQLKEYRFDRLSSHLRETRQGRGLLINPKNFLKIILLFSFFPIFLKLNNQGLFVFLVFSIFLLDFIKVFQEVFKKKLRLPVLTGKSVLIFGTVVVTLGFLFFFFSRERFFDLLLIERLIPLLIAAIVGLISFPSRIYRNILVDQAKAKRFRLNNLLAIGVTGSYGKGSTKEYLSTLLSEKYKVVKTKEAQNTTISVANTILSLLDQESEILVAEMGAYKSGDIRELCYMVRPKFGILTAVSDQHLSLFGGLEKIKKAKYELIEALPEDGLALFNGNNRSSLELANITKKKKVVYFTDYQNTGRRDFDIIAGNIKVERFGLTFDVFFGERKKALLSLKVKLIGKHNIENLLPAIYLADYLRLSEEEIREGLGKLLPIKKTMEPLLDQKGTTLIDDTFNASTASVMAALEYLKIFPGKKVLVLHPLLELGPEAPKDHYQIGLKVGEVCDHLIVTNNNYFNDLSKGAKKADDSFDLRMMKPEEIAKFTEKNVDSEGAVVFEGKEAGLALSLIKSKKVYH
jgi:UDP-N-acetylmuramoyl-tripeptide--D-alanyl-D-alanine ligase